MNRCVQDTMSTLYHIPACAAIFCHPLPHASLLCYIFYPLSHTSICEAIFDLLYHMLACLLYFTTLYHIEFPPPPSPSTILYNKSVSFLKGWPSYSFLLNYHCSHTHLFGSVNSIATENPFIGPFFDSKNNPPHTIFSQYKDMEEEEKEKNRKSDERER